jgi:hypothetical protein
MDSVPPIRRAAYEYLVSSASRWEKRDPDGKLTDCGYSTSSIAKWLDLPTNPVRRVLEDLNAYKLVERTSQGKGKPDLWAYRSI